MISEEDTQSDFLFSHSDIGHSLAQVVKSKLSEMNPFCEIETIEPGAQMQQIFSRASEKNRTISAVVHGFNGQWPPAIKLN